MTGQLRKRGGGVKGCAIKEKKTYFEIFFPTIKRIKRRTFFLRLPIVVPQNFCIISFFNFLSFYPGNH